MGDLGEAAEDEADETRPPTGRTGASRAPANDEGEDARTRAPKRLRRREEPEEPSAEDSDAPEFWSAEDKAAWNAVPPELRPVLKKYEQQRVEFVNEKAREAATIRARAVEDVQRANAAVDQAAQWWQQAGPALQRAFADKWSQVDWNDAGREEIPASGPGSTRSAWTRRPFSPKRTGARRRTSGSPTQRAEQAFEHAKRPSTPSSRTSCPTISAARTRRAKTYDELGKFLFAKGIPADRINQIHEAPIIELALAAMRFEQAQKKASPVLRSSEGSVTTANTTARATPTRVAPGPASRAGNRTSDAARQVGERFRKNGGNSIADAAELIRLNGL